MAKSKGAYLRITKGNKVHIPQWAFEQFSIDADKTYLVSCEPERLCIHITPYSGCCDVQCAQNAQILVPKSICEPYGLEEGSILQYACKNGSLLLRKTRHPLNAETALMTGGGIRFVLPAAVRKLLNASPGKQLAFWDEGEGRISITKPRRASALVRMCDSERLRLKSSFLTEERGYAEGNPIQFIPRPEGLRLAPVNLPAPDTARLCAEGVVRIPQAVRRSEEFADFRGQRDWIEYVDRGQIVLKPCPDRLLAYATLSARAQLSMPRRVADKLALCQEDTLLFQIGQKDRKITIVKDTSDWRRLKKNSLIMGKGRRIGFNDDGGFLFQRGDALLFQLREGEDLLRVTNLGGQRRLERTLRLTAPGGIILPYWLMEQFGLKAGDLLRLSGNSRDVTLTLPK